MNFDTPEKILASGATGRELALRVTAELMDAHMRPTLISAKGQEVETSVLAAGTASAPISFTDSCKTPHILVTDRLRRKVVTQFGDPNLRGIVVLEGNAGSHYTAITKALGIPLVICPEGSSIYNNRLNLCQNGKSLHVNEGKFVTISDKILFTGEGKIQAPQESAAFLALLGKLDRESGIRISTTVKSTYAPRIANYRPSEHAFVFSEYLLYDENSLPYFQLAILSNSHLKQQSLATLEKIQSTHYRRVFREYGTATAIRIFDPPLHEFLPDGSDEEQLRFLERELGVKRHHLLSLIKKHENTDSMMGKRGVRLAICDTDIGAMQIRAVFKAAAAENLHHVNIMLANVTYFEEVDEMRKFISSIGHTLLAEEGIRIDFSLETMIETPAAISKSRELAERTTEFYYGGNDLTSLILGMGRYDAESFLPIYAAKGIAKQNPFKHYDDTVLGYIGNSVKMARGGTKPRLTLCGRQAATAKAVKFCLDNEMGGVCAGAADTGPLRRLTVLAEFGLLELAA